MSKGEDYFGDVSLDSGLNDTEDGIDISEFINGPEDDKDEAKDKDDGPEGPDDEDDKDDDKNKKTADITDGVDASEFEKDIDNTKDKKNSVDDDSSSDNSSSPLQLLHTTLLEEGVIDAEEGVEIESSKQLLDAIRKKIESNEFADMNDDQKLYVEALRSGIPEADIKENQQNIKALNNITSEAIEANPELRKTLITQGLIAEGLTEAKAIKSANRIVEAGDDLEEAKDAYATLKTIEGSRIANETKKLREEAKNDEESSKAKLAKIKTNVLKTEEFIKGIKANSSTRAKVYETMTKVVAHDKEGNPLNALNAARHKDPEEMEKMESYLFHLTDGFKNFSVFKNKLKSNSIKELDKQLKSTQTGGGTSKSVSAQNGGGLSAALDNLTL